MSFAKLAFFTLSAISLASCSSTPHSSKTSEPPSSQSTPPAEPALAWISADLRGRMFDHFVSEINRLDGDGLLPRKNRPESWKKTTSKLRRLAVNAKDWLELGHVFKMLDATYPNLHAKVFLHPQLDLVAQTSSRPKIAASFGAEKVERGQTVFKYRIGSVKADLLADIPEGDRPQKDDELLSINGRSMKDWSTENFIFCKFPLREQCEAEFFDNFRKETLSWHRAMPLKYKIKRGTRTWTINVPFKTQTVSFTPDPSDKSDEPCGVEKDRYPGFKLVYRGYHACVFENEQYPGVPIVRIESFRYFDAPKDSAIRGIDEEVDQFWNRYWKAHHSSMKRVLIDVIGNGGGDTPVKWYALFFPKPYQEQYVEFKKIRELADAPDVLKELFYKEKAKFIWFDHIKTDGTWNKIPVNHFLPTIPQFCAKDDEDCSQGLFEPKENHFTGDVQILMDQWCISSCVGFVWNFKDVLKDRVSFYGLPDSADSAYGRVYIDLYLDSTTSEGFRTQVSPRPGQSIAKLPPGAILRQAVSVTRSTDSKGNVVSGIPQTVKGWVPVRHHYSGETWETSVVQRALTDF